MMGEIEMRLVFTLGFLHVFLPTPALAAWFAVCPLQIDVGDGPRTIGASLTARNRTALIVVDPLIRRAHNKALARMEADLQS